MDYVGTVHGNRIDLDEQVPFQDGTRVRINVRPENGLHMGSPAALLKLAGTLSDQEADCLLQAIEASRKIDKSLWPGLQ